MTDAKKQTGGSAYEEIEVARKEKADVRFKGRLLGSVDSRGMDSRGAKDRWTRLELYELESGKWVATSVGCSDRPGEIDIGEVEVIEPPFEADFMEVDQLPREQQAMAFWGHSWLAKAMADKMGWDVVEVIK